MPKTRTSSKVKDPRKRPATLRPRSNSTRNNAKRGRRRRTFFKKTVKLEYVPSSSEESSEDEVDSIPYDEGGESEQDSEDTSSESEVEQTVEVRRSAERVAEQVLALYLPDDFTDEDIEELIKYGEDRAKQEASEKRREEIVNGVKVPVNDTDKPNTDCRICLTSVVNTTIVDCGHCVMCIPCSRQLAEGSSPRCPVCNKGITEVKKLLM